MLIKLQAEQIGLFWDGIKSAIITVHQVPKEFELDYSNRFLSELLNGNLQCWLVYDEVEELKQIHALVITTIVDKKHFGIRELNICTLYGYRKLSNELVIDSINLLIAYAKANNCYMITAETNNDRVKEFMKLNNFVEYQSNYKLVL